MIDCVESFSQLNRTQYINIKSIFICSLVGLLNSFFYSNIGIMFVMCVVEVAILFFNLVRRDYMHYIAMYTVFLCFSMESEAFVGTDVFYGFKNFRIAGVNLAIWMMLPIIFLSFMNLKVSFARKNKIQRKIIKKILSFTLIGLIMSFVIYLVNDNGFASKTGSSVELINSLYTYILVCLELIAISWCVSLQQENIFILKQYLYSIIVGTAIVFLSCFFLRNYGNRGGLQSLQVSDIYFLLVCSIILVVYDEFNFSSKIVLGVAGILILILSLIYNASGKIVITSIFIPILMVVMMNRKGFSTKTIVILFVGTVALVLICAFILPMLVNTSPLLKIKYDQAMRLLAITSDNWFENLPSSPKMRITEFINIAVEYLKKPWYAFFGKGFCGTIKDNLGLFDDLSEFSFSQWELQLGAFYSMHESINCFFLVGGFWGLYIIISILIKVFREMHYSPWLVFGFMWVLLFYNYHLSISIYGIVALIVGLHDIDTKDCAKMSV